MLQKVLEYTGFSMTKMGGHPDRGFEIRIQQIKNLWSEGVRQGYKIARQQFKESWLVTRNL